MVYVQYPSEIVAEVKELYLAGRPMREIIAVTRERHPDICPSFGRQTVLMWSYRRDASNQNWKDLRKVVQAKTQEKVVESVADELGKLNGLLSETIGVMSKRLNEAKEMPVKSFENAAMVLARLIAQRAESLQPEPFPFKVENAEYVRALFEVMLADPEMGPVFERRRPAMLQAFQERAKELGLPL